MIGNFFTALFTHKSLNTYKLVNVIWRHFINTSSQHSGKRHKDSGEDSWWKVSESKYFVEFFLSPLFLYFTNIRMKVDENVLYARLLSALHILPHLFSLITIILIFISLFEATNIATAIARKGWNQSLNSFLHDYRDYICTDELNCLTLESCPSDPAYLLVIFW